MRSKIKICGSLNLSIWRQEPNIQYKLWDKWTSYTIYCLWYLPTTRCTHSYVFWCILNDLKAHNPTLSCTNCMAVQWNNMEKLQIASSNWGVPNCHHIITKLTNSKALTLQGGCMAMQIHIHCLQWPIEFQWLPSCMLDSCCSSLVSVCIRLQ